MNSMYLMVTQIKKEHLKGKYEHCFHANGFKLSVDICAHRYVFLYLHGSWLQCVLAALLLASLEG